MADRWTLVTPTGDLQLNASFSAPRLHPGGVDTNAALRRDGLRSYQRSGDGLRTPGPLILTGAVWRDDRLIPALVDELDDITDAVESCIIVRRENDAGTFIYSDLAGGPPPAITPDGIGGWRVEIELWPGSATPTFIPVHLNTQVHVYIDGTGSMDNDRAAIQSAMADLKEYLRDNLMGDAVDSQFTVTTAAADDDGERWLNFAAAPADDDALVILFFKEAEPRYHADPRVVANEPTSYYLEDFAAWQARIQSKTWRKLLLYTIGIPEDVNQAFPGHVTDAFSGANGYPTNPTLANQAASYRLDVPTGQSAAAYFADILAALQPGGS